MVKEELDELISQKEAAALRGVTLSAISDLIKRGRLEAVEIGGRKFLRRGDVVNYEPNKGGRPSAQSAAKQTTVKAKSSKKKSASKGKKSSKK